MKKVCIATLTHPSIDRDKFLDATVRSFIQSTSFDKIDWYIFINGKSLELKNTCLALANEFKDKVNFYFTFNDKNLGVGAGINSLNKQLEQYKYTYFLEGDWITLPPDISGFSKEWFNLTVEYFENNPNIDQILFRKYLNDTDDRQFGYGYWITKDNVSKTEKVGNLTLIHLNKKEYTNNPVFRRNKTFYDLEIFPLDEFFNSKGEAEEIKGGEFWGQAEINAEPKGFKLKSGYYMFGNTVHCDQWSMLLDWDKVKQKINSCNLYNLPSYSKCKYGYLFLNKEKMCSICDHTKDFTDLERHSQNLISKFY
jgi:hypothetical protein